MMIYHMMILLVFVLQGNNIIFNTKHLLIYFYNRGLDVVGSTDQLKQRLIDCEKTSTEVY